MHGLGVHLLFLVGSVLRDGGSPVFGDVRDSLRVQVPRGASHLLSFIIHCEQAGPGVECVMKQMGAPLSSARGSTMVFNTYLQPDDHTPRPSG